MKCPYLMNGVLIFPKEGWECPADVPGFKRVSNDPHSDDAWTFKPLWPSCPWRLAQVQKLPGCSQQKVTITMSCLKSKQILKLDDCKSCDEGRKWNE